MLLFPFCEQEAKKQTFAVFHLNFNLYEHMSVNNLPILQHEKCYSFLFVNKKLRSRPFVVLHFPNYSLICSCTHILLEPPIKDNSIIFCSVEYATKVSISVALCLLGPEMFSMNIYFRRLVIVTIQLKLNISLPNKLN
jgi:hypothetical protein